MPADKLLFHPVSAHRRQPFPLLFLSHLLCLQGILHPKHSLLFPVTFPPAKTRTFLLLIPTAAIELPASLLLQKLLFLNFFFSFPISFNYSFCIIYRNFLIIRKKGSFPISAKEPFSYLFNMNFYHCILLYTKKISSTRKYTIHMAGVLTSLHSRKCLLKSLFNGSYFLVHFTAEVTVPEFHRFPF